MLKICKGMNVETFSTTEKCERVKMSLQELNDKENKLAVNFMQVAQSVLTLILSYHLPYLTLCSIPVPRLPPLSIFAK